MIAHRALRDIQRCEAKYGEAWEEYKRQVPYLFIPVCLQAHIAFHQLASCTNSILVCLLIYFRAFVYYVVP